MKIYIVHAQTGEYSDHTEAAVRAFATEAAANECEQRLTDLARAAGLWAGEAPRSYDERAYDEREAVLAGLAGELKDAIDAVGGVNYTGIDFFVTSCPFEGP